VKEFVGHLREHQVRPYIARIKDRKTPGLDGRTTRSDGYRVSHRKRKRVEEIFGWLKTADGLRKTRFIDQAKTQMAAFISGTAYNLLSIAKLSVSEVNARAQARVTGALRSPLPPQGPFERRSKAIPENDLTMKFDLNLSVTTVSPASALAMFDMDSAT
jgi:hypothetical protein